MASAVWLSVACDRFGRELRRHRGFSRETLRRQFWNFMRRQFGRQHLVCAACPGRSIRLKHETTRQRRQPGRQACGGSPPAKTSSPLEWLQTPPTYHLNEQFVTIERTPVRVACPPVRTPAPADDEQPRRAGFEHAIVRLSTTPSGAANRKRGGPPPHQVPHTVSARHAAKNAGDQCQQRRDPKD